MSSEAGAASRVRLPVFWTLRESLRAIVAMGGSVIWLILLFGLTQLVASFLHGFVPAFIDGFLRSTLHDPSAGGGVVGIAGIVVTVLRVLVGFLLSINLALAVTRGVLFRERPSIEALFQWGRPQWRLAGVSLICGLILVVPAVAVVLAIRYLGDPALTAESLYKIGALLLIPIFIWLMGWMCLTTPVVATDDPESALRRAWRLSRGHRLRLIAIFLLSFLSLTIVIAILGALLGIGTAIMLQGSQLALRLVGEVMGLIASGVFQAWTAATTAVAFTLLMGTHERPVGGFPSQPA